MPLHRHGGRPAEETKTDQPDEDVAALLQELSDERPAGDADLAALRAKVDRLERRFARHVDR